MEKEGKLIKKLGKLTIEFQRDLGKLIQKAIDNGIPNPIIVGVLWFNLFAFTGQVSKEAIKKGRIFIRGELVGKHNP